MTLHHSLVLVLMLTSHLAAQGCQRTANQGMFPLRLSACGISSTSSLLRIYRALVSNDRCAPASSDSPRTLRARLVFVYSPCLLHGRHLLRIARPPVKLSRPVCVHHCRWRVWRPPDFRAVMPAGMARHVIPLPPFESGSLIVVIAMG